MNNQDNLEDFIDDDADLADKDIDEMDLQPIDQGDLAEGPPRQAEREVPM